MWLTGPDHADRSLSDVYHKFIFHNDSAALQSALAPPCPEVGGPSSYYHYSTRSRHNPQFISLQNLHPVVSLSSVPPGIWLCIWLLDTLMGSPSAIIPQCPELLTLRDLSAQSGN